MFVTSAEKVWGQSKSMEELETEGVFQCARFYSRNKVQETKPIFFSVLF